VITNLKLLKSFFRYHRKSVLLFSGVRIFRPFSGFLRYFPDFSAFLPISFKFTGFIQISWRFSGFTAILRISLNLVFSRCLENSGFFLYLRISQFFSGFPVFLQMSLHFSPISPDFSDFSRFLRFLGFIGIAPDISPDFPGFFRISPDFSGLVFYLPWSCPQRHMSPAVIPMESFLPGKIIFSLRHSK
jgi:hypothetical protein